MRIRFHTFAAVVVLLASGAWVATGKFAHVGSEAGEQGGAAVAAETSPTPAETSADARSEAPAKAAPVEPGAGPLTVAFKVAHPEPYERTIRLSGQTEADKQVVLVARSSGAIAKLSVAEGDTVPTDGLVMALDGPEKYAALDSAQSQYDTASHQLDSNQKLFDRGSLPQLQLDASRSARDAARSALEAAKAEIDRLEVHAPFAGVIDKVFVEVGSWAQPGTQVASLLALDPIVVVGEVNERDLQAVTKGTAASVTFGDGTVAEGEVRYVRREASGLTRTFPVEVAIANPNAAIPSGMSAEIRLAVKTAPAVVLPRSAITLAANGELGVRVLTADNRVAFHSVTIIDDTPKGLVLSGIEDGARIIVLGQDMVAEGAQVVAVPAPADDAQKAAD